MTDREGLAFIEVTGFTPTLAVVDTVDKAADVRVLEIELNDFYGTAVKIAGRPAALQAALDAARRLAEQMKTSCVTSAINAPDPRARRAILTGPECNELLEAEVVHVPDMKATSRPQGAKEKEVNAESSFAIGFIETQGFTAVFEAIDSACKAANVEVIGREKLGGGYITVLIKGDVAAVNAAIQTGRERVEGLGKLIAAHVIPRPSAAVLSLLPK